VAGREFTWAALFPPYFVACSALIYLEILIPFSKVQVDGLDSSILGFVIASVNNGTGHSAKHGLDDI
jgi:hypothetical protein